MAVKILIVVFVLLSSAVHGSPNTTVNHSAVNDFAPSPTAPTSAVYSPASTVEIANPSTTTAAAKPFPIHVHPCSPPTLKESTTVDVVFTPAFPMSPSTSTDLDDDLSAYITCTFVHVWSTPKRKLAETNTVSGYATLYAAASTKKSLIMRWWKLGVTIIVIGVVGVVWVATSDDDESRMRRERRRALVGMLKFRERKGLRRSICSVCNVRITSSRMSDAEIEFHMRKHVKDRESTRFTRFTALIRRFF